VEGEASHQKEKRKKNKTWDGAPFYVGRGDLALVSHSRRRTLGEGRLGDRGKKGKTSALPREEGESSLSVGQTVSREQENFKKEIFVHREGSLFLEKRSVNRPSRR